MRVNYLEVPNRLLAYRKSLSKSQEEMGEKLGVKQGHYWLIENGRKVISYRSLKLYEKNAGDVYFLITGKKRYYGIGDSYIRKCNTFVGKVELLKFIVWLTKQGVLLCDMKKEEELILAWKYAQLAEYIQKTDSIWINIRKIERLSQAQFAKRLDINIKRYQRMEKMSVYPDAEILNTLFFEFGYSPLLFLKHELFYLDEIDKIWDDFPEEIRMNLLPYLEDMTNLIRQYESYTDNIQKREIR